MEIKQSRNPLGGFKLISEDGTITEIMVTQGIDLIVSQKAHGGKWVHFSTYSDPGTMPYSIFLKFLHMTRERIPLLPRTTQRVPEEMRDVASRSAAVVAMTPFPISFPTYLESPPATAHFVEINNVPFIEIVSNGGKMLFSKELAKVLVATVPKLYPFTDLFRIMRLEVRKQIRDGNMDKYKKSVIEKRVVEKRVVEKPAVEKRKIEKPLVYRQMEFPFMKEHRKGKPKPRRKLK